MKLEVESYDYRKAIEAVQKLLDGIFTYTEGAKIEDIPSATLIVDTVIDEII